MKPLVFSLFSEHPWLASLSQKMEIGQFILRDFPDGETYLKFENDLSNREIIFLVSLDRPNPKLFPLLLAAQTAKELGAKKITLIAPYLAYMRQDKRFHEGEAWTAPVFAKLLSGYFDALITVDPHLHRYSNLNQIYSIETTVLHAAPMIAQWIQKNISKPVLIGPDGESAQWVADVAAKAGAPFVVLQKIRTGDTAVEESRLDLDGYAGHTPVLVDDIISTGRTLMGTIDQLKAAGWPAPVCIGVHAVFAGNAYQELLATGARMVTCNTIGHVSNAIDLSEASF